MPFHPKAATVAHPVGREDKAMRQTITIEHSVVASNRSYDQMKEAIAYDRFSSLLSAYQSAEITPISQLIEQKLEALVAEVTGGGEGKEP